MHLEVSSRSRVELHKVLVVSLLLISLDLVCIRAVAFAETFTGKAINGKGVVEYVEYHTVKYENGRVRESQTVYYDPNNRKIGDLLSDYSHGPQFGSYRFRDNRAHYEDGAKVQADKIRLFRRESPEDELESTTLPREFDQIVGQGFHQFIRYNLESIAEGEIYHVRLVLPSRLDQYRFRIRKRQIDGDTLYVRLEIDSWLLRLFAPHIDAEYDLNTRRLLRYEGVSNLTDTSGKHRNVTITYSYES